MARNGEYTKLKMFNDKHPDIVESYALAKRLLQHADNDDIQQRMRQFREFGNIGYEGGLLSVSQIKDHHKRKGRDLNSFCIKSEELETALNLLEEYAKTVTGESRVNFAVSGNHWLAIDFKIKKGKVESICILDSMGISKGYVETVHAQALISHKFPNAHKTQSSLKKQNALQACAAFTLDEIDQLASINKYLPLDASRKKYKDFHDYVNDPNNRSDQSVIASIAPDILAVNLPLVSRRTAQTLGSIYVSDKTDEIPWIKQSINENEKNNTPMNKWKETIGSSVFRHLASGDNTGKIMNRRLEYQLKLMARRNLDLMLNYKNADELNNALESVSLKGLEYLSASPRFSQKGSFYPSAPGSGSKFGIFPQPVTATTLDAPETNSKTPKI